MDRVVKHKIEKPDWLSDEEFRGLMEEVSKHMVSAMGNILRKATEGSAKGVNPGGISSSGCEHIAVSVTIGEAYVKALRDLLEKAKEKGLEDVLDDSDGDDDDEL